MTLLRLIGGIVSACIWFFAQPALAAGFPSQPVRIVVPLGAGGGADQIARLLAKELHEMWDQPVIVENMPGADLSIGAMAVARSTPNGYTLLFTPAPAVTVNPLVFPDLRYGLDDFVPVMIATQAPFLLVVNERLNVKSVSELIAVMQSDPDKLNNANSSTLTRLTSELFKSMAGVSYAEVPYRGGGQTALSTVSGETDMTFTDMGSVIPLLQRSEIRVLAVTSASRAVVLPNVPTMSESGLEGYASTGYSVLLAPAKTPPETIATINAALQKIMKMPSVVKRIEALGNEAMVQTPAEARNLLIDTQKRWARLISERNIRFH